MLERALSVAVEAALEAGRMLREEFHRGPRGSGGTAPIDTEAEGCIRARLEAAFPSFGYRGEETGVRPGDDPARWWVVDPNDGTAAYLRGHRGASVSIALLQDGQPVLGVVYSPCFPDDRGDLVAGGPELGLTRNEVSLPARALPRELDRRSVVIVSQSADKKPGLNLRCSAPARYRCLPSIAYRLALVAAGEGEACVSLQHPRAVD
ncbi:MAG: inositol monophosphatase family protein, partial [Candidatus Eremiobacterota bacterium]